MNPDYSNLSISTEEFLTQASQKLTVIRDVLTQYGDLPLLTYLRQLFPQSIPCYQKRDGLFDVVYRYSAALLGESVARRVVADLEAYPVIRTANHHGVDYFAQTFQGTLLFALNALTNALPLTTIPIFAFGNIPLNNATYPRGMLLYQINKTDEFRIPCKLPVFPDHFKRKMVSVVSAFDEAMIRRTEIHLQQMTLKGQIPSAIADTISKIFQDEYRDPAILNLADYSQQAVALNSRLWRRLFTDQQPLPDLVYLEIENITSALLQDDLRNPASLAWAVMFDRMLREHVLQELDGTRACWDLPKLQQRLNKHLLTNEHQPNTIGSGTIFFWGIDALWRRIPLSLQTRQGQQTYLCGVDDDGGRWEFPYTRQTILRGLREKQLLPSLFTCFLVLAFARGMACVGGYFQCEYLPVMQRGLLTALHNTTGYEALLPSVRSVPTNFYLDGMVGILTSCAAQTLVPAGPIEIIAGGGLQRRDLEQIQMLTVREAHLADLQDTLPDALPRNARPSGWENLVATDCFYRFQHRLPIKMAVRS